jgi:aminomethyltransferase
LPRRSPLLSAHTRLGAKLTNFGGWDMPLQYTGVVGEHNAVRTAVGVFDVSHLGKLRVSGPGARRALNAALSADIEALAVGRASYALVLTDQGGCIDDLFVYRLGDEEWMVIPNAANVDAVAGAIRDCGGNPVDEWDRWAIVAIQGPQSFGLFERAWPEAHATDLSLHAWRSLDVCGSTGMVARTGYTGERGFELFTASGVAEEAWERLLELGGLPVGLGARDTLRLEMGYALHGHELGPDINPLEAGLGWAVAWDKDFRGRDALLRVRERGPARRLVGVRCTDRGVPRRGHAVLSEDVAVATVTSGNFSPTLGCGIALALGDTDGIPEVDARVVIDARGRRIRGIIVKPPFVKRSSR